MNPIVHTENSLKHFGGDKELDFNKYLILHKKMDCSKMYFSDNRHRALTHHLFWVNEVMLPLFGDYITLESGKKISIKDICEQHILEDFRMKFIPTVQDYLQEMDMIGWMQNGNGTTSSAKKLYPSLNEDIKPKIDPNELEKQWEDLKKKFPPYITTPHNPFDKQTTIID